eukprot:COSAG01_NODE_40723_length_460_cov_1.138504_2_plen_21_part_01
MILMSRRWYGAVDQVERTDHV